jgi:CubicO group peptidase (beta-lactamase class C family)
MEAVAVISEAGALTLSGITDPLPWWSFTKTVIAIAVLRLVDNGQLNLDEPLDGVRYNLRQLLRHEAGLADYGALSKYHRDVAANKEPWPIERLLAAVDADRLRYEPGRDWAYSNVGYLKIAQLVERTTGLPLKVALEQLVFEPCDLTTARLARTLADLDDVQMGDVRGYHPGWVFHGLVVGTVADAARLLSNLLDGHLLNPATFSEMLKGRRLPEHANAHADAAYGLGLMLWTDNPLDRPIGHLGEGPGSKIAVLAQGSKAAAVWAASASSLDTGEHALSLLRQSELPQICARPSAIFAACSFVRQKWAVR